MDTKEIKKREISPKGDGHPYVERAREEYKKLTPEERAKVDAFAAELHKLLYPNGEDEFDGE